MTGTPGLSIRDAIDSLRATDDPVVHADELRPDRIALDFAQRFAGIPANSRARTERAVHYRATGSDIPVLLGLYGCEDRVRRWLPGLPAKANAATAGELLDGIEKPEHVDDPACQQRVEIEDVDLARLPVLRATPRDAGPYLTMGMVHAHDPRTGESALSVHRMLVLDRNRLAIWMVPGRMLRTMHEVAIRRSERLPVSISIGAPPAAIVASALSSSVLRPEVGKLAFAGALARAPISVATGVSQPVPVLAESEIVLEGYLDQQVADESLSDGLDVSLPEFLGYDGEARPDLPVLTVTAVTTRQDPIYQAVIGPGREQSVILGLAGALSVALSGDDADWQLLEDLHYSAAGGGMLMLTIAVRSGPLSSAGRLEHIARRIFDRHRFVKLIVFTDADVDIRCAEDVCWAITTRSNLGTDCTTLGGYRPLAMDPSQSEEWSRARGSDGGGSRTFVDATVPYELRAQAARSFPSLVDRADR